MLPTRRIRIQIVTGKHFLTTIWFWLVVVVLVSLPQASFAYDGRNQTTAAYDSKGDSGVSYDAVAVLPTREKKDGTAEDRVPFAKFHEFVAAESAGVLEYDVGTYDTLTHWSLSDGLDIHDVEVTPQFEELIPSYERRTVSAIVFK
jgi:hypothetical protein